MKAGDFYDNGLCSQKQTHSRENEHFRRKDDTANQIWGVRRNWGGKKENEIEVQSDSEDCAETDETQSSNKDIAVVIID